MIGAIYNDVYGTSTYVRNGIQDTKMTDWSCEDDVFRITTEVNGLSIVNIYKPPMINWPPNVIKTPHNLPTIYIGDFNSHHNLWGYENNDDNGEKLLEWAESNNLHFAYSS